MSHVGLMKYVFYACMRTIQKDVLSFYPNQNQFYIYVAHFGVSPLLNWSFVPQGFILSLKMLSKK